MSKIPDVTGKDLPRHLAAIVSVVTHEPRDPAHYKALLQTFHDLVHVTVEVHPCQHVLRR